MTDNKTSKAKGGKTRARPATAQRPGARPAAANAPRTGQAVPNMDQAIAQAQRGRVNMPPAKAIEMAGTLYARGQFGQVERVCRQILAARPTNSDAHNILGVALAALGRTDDAVASLKRAIKLNNQAPSYHSNLGEVLRQAGRLDEATQSLETAARLDPKNAQALNNLGIINYDRKNYAKAVEMYRAAIEANPQMAEAYNNLGNALRVTGDINGAHSAYEEALTLRAKYPEVYNNLGTLLMQQRKVQESEHAFRKAIQQNKTYVEAHNNLAQLLYSQKNDVEALRVLGEALKFAPKNVTTLVLTARIQLRRNNSQAAEQAVRFALREKPDSAEALTLLGQVLHETDRYDEALEVLDKAVKSQPDNADALNFYGVTLKSVGRLDEAREHILKALSLNSNMYGAFANLNDLIDFSQGVGEELFERMDKIFGAAKNKEWEPLLPLHFAYAKALDDRGQHEKALEHYIIGGKMKRATLDYKESDTFDFFDSIRATFPKEFFDNRPFEGLDDDRFVFIVGMPRSGSTLVEQILSSHPDVYGAGEVKFLARSLGQLRDRFPTLGKYPDMVKGLSKGQLGILAQSYQEQIAAGAGNAKRITDKLLTNYFFLGLINLLFPKARVINTMRDPVDTCLSGFTKLFKDDMPHSYDLGELGRYYGKYRQIMEHWKEVLPEGFLTTVVYEDVVADTEKEARRLIEFLGLPWNDKCLEFHKSDRPVKTASVAQVRKPIYKSSVKRYAKYGAGLQPLIDACAIDPGKAAEPAKDSKPAKSAKGSKSKAKENA